MADIGILVVDDHPLVREGLVEVIRRNRGMTVLAQAENGTDAIEAARRCRPDVILLDIGLPDMNGLQVLRRISREVPEARVIMLTVYDDEAYRVAPNPIGMVVKAVRLGAIGYLCKTCPISKVVEAIRMAHQGRPILPTRAVPALLAALRSSDVSGGGAAF